MHLGCFGCIWGILGEFQAVWVDLGCSVLVWGVWGGFRVISVSLEWIWGVLDGFGVFWVGLVCSRWLWGRFGWIWGGFGSGARPGPPNPGVPGCPHCPQATSPPLLICRGNAGLWLGFPAPPRGLKHSCHVRNPEFWHLLFWPSCSGPDYFCGSQKAQHCAGSCS